MLARELFVKAFSSCYRCVKVVTAHTQTKQKQWFLYENGGFIWNNSFYESSQFDLKENADTTFCTYNQATILILELLRSFGHHIRIFEIV